MEEKKSAQNQQKLFEKIRAKQLAAQMVFLSREIRSVQNKANQLALQMELLTKESVEVLRKILAD